MSFQFSKVREKIVEADFKADDQTLHIHIRANAITRSKMEGVHDKIAAGIRERRKIDEDVETGFNEPIAQIDGLAEMLDTVIAEWDADDGEPTFEFLRTLPVGFLSDLLMFCTEAVGPKKKTARA